LAGVDASFDDLPNRPFAITPIVPPSVSTIDLIHRFYTQQAQIDGGAMDKFAAYSDAGSFTLSFYDTMSLPVPRIARDFTVCDRFFQSAFGGSFLNHIWLIAAQSPTFPNAPGPVEGGSVIPDGPNPFPLSEDKVFTGQDANFTPDYYVVNTSYSVNTPHPSNVEAADLMPNQTFPTIGDRLSAAGVSWAWYSGGWDDALANAPTDERFQCHHQPFVYFANFADGTAAKAEHLKDERDFLAVLNAGALPAVSFVKPVGINDEHPGFAPLLTGETHLAELIEAIMAAPNWRDTAIIITYDENGGFADHVAPPVIDRFGPGTRVPTIVISPYAKRRFVDHTEYETVSILATLERRYGLAPLTHRDARARDLTPTLTLDNVREAR
jgi:phospholipase C